jgi:hypothetical protein
MFSPISNLVAARVKGAQAKRPGGFSFDTKKSLIYRD